MTMKLIGTVRPGRVHGGDQSIEGLVDLGPGGLLLGAAQPGIELDHRGERLGPDAVRAEEDGGCRCRGATGHDERVGRGTDVREPRDVLERRRGGRGDVR
jgi:hypothetical protein